MVVKHDKSRKMMFVTNPLRKRGHLMFCILFVVFVIGRISANQRDGGVPIAKAEINITLKDSLAYLQVDGHQLKYSKNKKMTYVQYDADVVLHEVTYFNLKSKKALTFFVYAKVGEQVNITGADGHFVFSGAHPRQNEFLFNAFAPTFNQPVSFMFSMNADRGKDDKKKHRKFEWELQAIVQHAQALLSKNKPLLNKQLYYILDREVFFKYKQLKKTYLNIYPTHTPASFDHVPNEPMIEKASLLSVPSYRRTYLPAYFFRDKKHLEERVDTELHFKNIDSFFKTPKIRWSFKEKVIEKELAYHGLSNPKIVAYYEQYINDVHAKPYLVARLKKIYREKSQLVKGAKAPPVTAYDVAGKSVSISDFKGKLVYIDLWATWCVPCLEELPHFKKIKQRFKNRKDIVFVSISVDKPKDKAKWKKMLKDKQMKGVQLLAKNGRKSAFYKRYQVFAIPTFIMIDKQGDLVSSQAPRPSKAKKLTDLVMKNL